MSDAGNIIAAVLADVSAAISGVTTAIESVSIDELKSEDFPFVMVLQTDYEAEVLEWGQERRTWTISCSVWQENGTREQMHTKLEAIRDQVNADKTLGGSVERATFHSAVPYSHPDAARLAGIFVVQAEKVV